MQNFHVHAMNSTWWKGAKEKGTNRATTRGPRASGWLFDANRYLTKLEEADFSLLSMPANVDFFHRAVRASLSLSLYFWWRDEDFRARVLHFHFRVHECRVKLVWLGGRGKWKEGRKKGRKKKEKRYFIKFNRSMNIVPHYVEVESNEI